MWQLHVHRIEGVSDSAGFMDKTDPYVKVIAGKQVFKTKVKENAGGTLVFFDEIIAFQQVSASVRVN
jgi:hypothetical protein